MSNQKMFGVTCFVAVLSGWLYLDPCTEEESETFVRLGRIGRIGKMSGESKELYHREGWLFGIYEEWQWQRNKLSF
jgi:hypothetical protein